MAEKDKEPVVDSTFRRQLAVSIAVAFVTRHGGLGSPLERDANARMIWAFADAIAAAEHLPPLHVPGSEEPFQGIVLEGAAQQPARPAHPSDEWGVRHGDKLYKQFGTREEAQHYANKHRGSTVVQLSGPGANEAMIAPAHA